jgi:ankyrin repeat protein
MLAISQSSIEICKLLIDAGSSVHSRNPNGWSNTNTPCLSHVVAPLHYAAFYAATEVVEFLLDGDMNAIAEDGATPLLLAAVYHGTNSNIFSCLHSCGAKFVAEG